MSNEEWKELKDEILDKYLEVGIFSKVNVLTEDVKGVMEEHKDSDRPAKVIIFSNFQEAFTRVATFLGREGIPYSCVPIKRILY
jgi:ERCC4-related helicase